jgi:S-adenosyl-methyltransferase mraW
VNKYSKEELIRIFKEYGEEKFATKIANEIIEERKRNDICTTFDLNRIIDKVKPYSKKGHKSKQVFQALRIEVNKEIVNLEKAISNMIDCLSDKGRIAIITFHSLEDKAVKKVFKEKEGRCSCPSDLPVCVCGYKSFGRNVSKKAILPSNKELEENTRAKSAKLRVFERVEKYGK